MKQLSLTLSLLIWTGLANTQCFSAEKIMPVIGLSQPIGSAGDEWNGGLSVGVQFPLKNSKHGLWSVVTSFQAMTPNAEDMLETNGRELKVEQQEGRSNVLECGILGEHAIWGDYRSNAALLANHGAALYLVNDLDVHVRGSYATPTAAMTREFFRDGRTIVVPGIAAGISFRLQAGLTAQLHLRHLFTPESGRTLLLAGIGLHPY